MNNLDQPDPNGPGIWLNREYCLATLKIYCERMRRVTPEATIRGMLMFKFIVSDLKLGAMITRDPNR